MSANSSQMEEQGTFSPGEALVSYENIRKPFKMQIKMAEHETGTSPDDNTLFDLISKGKYSIGMRYRDIYLYVAVALILLNWIVKNLLILLLDLHLL